MRCREDTPHPFEFVETSALPSPARGEGATTRALLAERAQGVRAHHRKPTLRPPGVLHFFSAGIADRLAAHSITVLDERSPRGRGTPGAQKTHGPRHLAASRASGRKNRKSAGPAGVPRAVFEACSAQALEEKPRYPPLAQAGPACGPVRLGPPAAAQRDAAIAPPWRNDHGPPPRPAGCPRRGPRSPSRPHPAPKLRLFPCSSVS